MTWSFVRSWYKFHTRTQDSIRNSPNLQCYGPKAKCVTFKQHNTRYSLKPTQKQFYVFQVTLLNITLHYHLHLVY